MVVWNPPPTANFGTLTMRCLSCPHSQAKDRGVGQSHHCDFSGAQVAPFGLHDADDFDANASDRAADDPDYPCPLTLADGYLRPALVAGILCTVDQREKLGKLLDCYRPGQAVRLAAVYAEWAERTLAG